MVRGQKTGFYLDQRDARDLVQRLARGRRVLDLFCYTGGFSVAAARGGAVSVTGVDSSGAALEAARRSLATNGFSGDPRLIEDDGFRFVRQDAAGYDLLVIDPPPLARRKADVPRAARAYKDLLLHSLRRAAPGAFLVAFSCSHASRRRALSPDRLRCVPRQRPQRTGPRAAGCAKRPSRLDRPS